jgi:hypothetical protein
MTIEIGDNLLRAITLMVLIGIFYVALWAMVSISRANSNK